LWSFAQSAHASREQTWKLEQRSGRVDAQKLLHALDFDDVAGDFPWPRGLQTEMALPLGQAQDAPSQIDDTGARRVALPTLMMGSGPSNAAAPMSASTIWPTQTKSITCLPP
jgi:hypothetical protein